jgi:hypothetical protein
VPESRPIGTVVDQTVTVIQPPIQTKQTIKNRKALLARGFVKGERITDLRAALARRQTILKKTDATPNN